MTSRERVAAAMRLEEPDRVPVMCQLSIGHYFVHSGFDPVDIWHDTQTFGDALLELQERYDFDGVLVNLPGRDPCWRSCVRALERLERATRVHWRNGRITEIPDDDLPTTEIERPFLDEVDAAQLLYVEPYGLQGRELLTCIPAHQFDTVRHVRRAAPHISVHAEVFSPFTQLLELLGYESALMALLDEPARVKEVLAAVCRGTTQLMAGYAQADADAILISSAFSGAGFISKEHYREFVLPFERQVIADFGAAFPHIPVYTHVCGAIGDRLELIADTGTQGIDTLDPPPLGTVDLADAKQRIGHRLFIKGNVDPVHTLLNARPEQVFVDAMHRIQIAAPRGGYILSSACSVAPHTCGDNIRQLVNAAERFGWYR